MIQASTRAVAHEANINLIRIRNFEIQYFGKFFSNFGTQSAFIISFVLSGISQVPGWDSKAPIFWIATFWIGAALSISGATHVLVCTVFITVFGEGLALRGPLGSMITAVEGMIIEQQQVLYIFNITIFCFAMHTIGMYWIMMEQTGAILCTILTIGFMPVWFRYTRHIYRKFYFGNINIAEWQEDNKKPKVSTNENDDNDDIKEGYLSMKVTKAMGFDSKKWERFYFVIENTLMHYYKDQRAFQLDFTNAINKRPIDLEGYSLIAQAKEAPYHITLVPADPEDIRKGYRFKCDTRTEFDQWFGYLSEAIQSSTSIIKGEIIKYDDSNSCNSNSDEEEN